MNPPKLIIPKGWEECSKREAEFAILLVREYHHAPSETIYIRRIKRKPTKRRKRVKPHNDIPYSYLLQE